MKNLLVSKTAIVGALTAALGILDLLGAFPYLASYAPHILLASGIATVVLRSLTSTPASLKARVRAKDLMR